MGTRVGSTNAALNLLPGTRVTTWCGVGTLQYTKPGGWLGVKLDGETRVDEYPVETVEAAS